MQNGMLGNSEVLRKLWGGPLLDLTVKLNGENGPEWEKALKVFLRKQNPWTTWVSLCGIGNAIEILGADKVLTYKDTALWSIQPHEHKGAIRYTEGTILNCAEENSDKTADWRLIYLFGHSLKDLYRHYTPTKRHIFHVDESVFTPSYLEMCDWPMQRCPEGYYLINVMPRFSEAHDWESQELEIISSGLHYERAHESQVAEVINAFFQARKEVLLKDWTHWGVGTADYGAHIAVGHFTPQNGIMLSLRGSGLADTNSPDLGVCLIRRHEV